MTQILETRDLVTNFYTYEGVVKALNKISLVVDHGSTFGLVGESGCGKSVTVRSIMRILQEPGKIESGKILFYNSDDKSKVVDILEQSNQAMENLRGNQISMIFQEPNSALNPVFSIGEQVSESFMFHQKKEMYKQVLDDLNASFKHRSILHHIQRALYTIASLNPDNIFLKFLNRIPIINLWQKRLRKEALKRSIKILKQLAIPLPEEVVKLFPHNLSGGMKQRVVIAIALACNPALLIADEATSNLDVTIQAQILDLLQELKRTQISSILLITHDLGVIAETCDRAGVMYAGNLCEVADVEDLFENPCHPYTRALLASVPKMHQETELTSIDGAVPNLVFPPSGCRFHPRCPHVMQICKEKEPQPFEVKQGHWVSCHLNQV